MADPSPAAPENEIPVFSTRDPHEFTPKDSLNSYTIHPLTFRERVAFRADLARTAGVRPSQEDFTRALVSALHEISPANLQEALDVVEEATAARTALEALEPNSPQYTAALARGEEAQARVNQVMVLCSDVPVFADLRAAQERWQGMAPYVAAKHALRGWSGPGMPPFNRVKGVVPDDLLDQLPPNELASVGWRSFLFLSLDKVSVGNSEPPSP